MFVLISSPVLSATRPMALLLALACGSVATAGQASASQPDRSSGTIAKPATRIFGVTVLSDGRTGYHVDANGPLSPEPFYLLKSRRLVVDFPGVSLRGRPELPPPVAPVRSMRLAQFTPAPHPVARLVVGVDRSIEYRLIPDSTGATIEFGNPNLLEPLPAAEPTSPVTPSGEPTASPAPTPAPTPSLTSRYPRLPFIDSTDRSVRGEF